ncbi:HAD-IIB family hydrolase [Noviherbaspirillum sp. CPCC 100848]|uniref:HAD-IIB family hydrolase n=1 Tax=Noviherbaspirillum album TaxID=3080276 RepID=A0ABU6J8G3_9BURK|nr:HAD-IIB family hydrolase [Noviherbaspirillum sp. CPCC 100848]MEC4719718.1 HAD-IIB family hydrolase [Noviherbaspirillum sp. CPCC 100848]
MKPLAEWPREQRRELRGILTDIDDTLTTAGALTPPVLQALNALRESGLQVIAVTGRPTYWAMPLLRLCRFDAVIAENGASAFWIGEQGRMQSRFYADETSRRQHRMALEALVPVLRGRFPQLQVADDAPLRIGDLAFDIGENIPPLPEATVAGILACIREQGFHATASSIHAHAAPMPFCKQAASERLLRDVFGVGDETARLQYAFVGDSGNDARMFAHYPQAIGVANVRRHLPLLDAAPAYVTVSECGAGFVEVADAILASR